MNLKLIMGEKNNKLLMLLLMWRGLKMLRYELADL